MCRCGGCDPQFVTCSGDDFDADELGIDPEQAYDYDRGHPDPGSAPGSGAASAVGVATFLIELLDYLGY